jgi:MYXO-CTERM domain-containing protein
LSAALCLALDAAPARAAERTFDAGSLIIPMDLAYQDSGLLQAYGLIFELLRGGVDVYWVIDADKTWHTAACDTPGDECAWDCAEQGSGAKCAYPTASPDFFAAATVVYDGDGALAPGTAIADHGYRGGPFVVDASERDAAMAIVDAWNDAGASTRAVFRVVSVHEATAAFTGNVRKQMVAAPTIAVFSDGNEDIATSYLRAAGIPQSNGTQFPAGKCGGAGTCGPGTQNPDMLTVPSIMGDMGTCDAVNYDHENGALFTADGLPAYCQIMSMHWDVGDRETVRCNGGGCPATQAQCAGETFTYHGHEVVAEVRQFLQYPVHFFAECQAVNAYENTTPNPAWPFLDDDARDGHFLTTQGMPPACPCTDADFECVAGGCGGADCCLPKDAKELGAGFMIAPQPNAATLQILHPEVPYNQLDGSYGTIGGSEPAYNLSSYLGTMYKNDREVTFITGPMGPGVQDVWMTGYLDGECDILPEDDVGGPPPGECNGGKVSYLGGHAYGTAVPMSGNDDSHGARLFLNALFEADCVTSVGQPGIVLGLQGPLVIAAQNVPVERDFSATYANQGRGAALDAVMSEIVPASVVVAGVVDGAVVAGGAEWMVGSISGDPPLAGDPPHQGTRGSTLEFPDFGDYPIELRMQYRVGQSVLDAPPVTVTVRVALDSDGDGVPDDDDSDPNDPNACGDTDADTCDDCSGGSFDPANDGPDADGDGTCDAGEDGGGGGGGEDDSGCGCRAGASGGSAFVALALVGLAARRRRRRRR